MVIGVVRIRNVGPLEVGRQHAADELDVLFAEVGWRVAAVEQPVVCDRDALTAASSGFAAALTELRAIDASLREVETLLGEVGAPWTPGRIPTFQSE